MQVNSLVMSDKLSTPGKWAFMISLLFVFSFRSEYRLQFAGFLVHPYLIVLIPTIAFTLFRIAHIPKRTLNALILFFAFFSLACLQNNNPLAEIFKVGASLATFIFFAFSVQSEKDFNWISSSFLFIALVIGIQGFLLGEEKGVSRLEGINVLEGIGNKNAQSLFTLPGLFFGSFLVIKSIGEKSFLKSSILIVSLFFIIISLFLSANRSGWLGMAIIFISILFVTGLRGRTLFFSLVVVGISYLAIDRFASDIVSHKRKQTEEGYSSDTGRKLLMIESFQVGMENPFFGVGMDELHRQMALRLGTTKFGVKKMDTHFLPGYLFGGAGIITLSLFLFFLSTLFKRELNQYIKRVRQVRMMVIFFVGLFIARSFFTREILYSPTFMAGLGLIYGYYIYLVRQYSSLVRG